MQTTYICSTLTCTTFGQHNFRIKKNEGCLQENYVIWSKKLLKFVFLWFMEFSLADMSDLYNHPVRQKRNSK